MRVILAVDRGLDVFERWIAGLILLAIALILFFNVVTRYFFGSSSVWIEEMSRYLMVWLTFIGASIMARRGGHIAVDILMRAIRPALQRWLTFLIAAVGFVTMLYVAWFGWGLTWSVYQSGQVAPTMPVPVAMLYLSIPVGGLLMARNFLRMAILALRGELADASPEEPQGAEKVPS
jgi:TRAP-type C4-dicarboxylate transport system permease small subunit